MGHLERIFTQHNSFTQIKKILSSPKHWTCLLMYAGTVEPWLSESPLSEPLVIQTLFQILKYQETIGFSAKPSNIWNACVIFRLVISKIGIAWKNNTYQESIQRYLLTILSICILVVLIDCHAPHISLTHFLQRNRKVHQQ